MTLELFIIYHHEDSVFAKELYDRLQLWNYSAWLDESSRPSYISGRRQKIDLFKSSDIVICILSPEAVSSEKIMAEAKWAHMESKLWLLMYRQCKPTDFLINVDKDNFIDFVVSQRNGYMRLQNTLAMVSARSDLQSRSTTDHTRPNRIPSSIGKKSYRTELLRLVDEDWIKPVIGKFLGDKKPFDLQVKPTSPGKLLRQVDLGSTPIPPKLEVGHIFRNMGYKMLILGAPGAGKTVLLYQLAHSLRLLASRDEKQLLPVIFNLSSWTRDRKQLKNWLLDEFDQRYKIPRPVAREWIENDKLILFLDGLDEIPVDYRNKCVERINDFRLQYRSGLAICCRIADYGILTSKLDLPGGIELQPLTLDQIKNYLEQDREKNLTALRQRIEEDITLQRIAETPFLLDTMIFAYENASLMTLNIESTDNAEKAWRDHLFDAYVMKCFAAKENKTLTKSQIRRYLAWLARKMITFDQTVFYITNLRPEWLPDKQRSIHTFLAAFVVGPLMGIVFGWLASEVIVKAVEFSKVRAGDLSLDWPSLALGLASGLPIGLVISITYMPIATIIGAFLFTFGSVLGAGVVATIGVSSIIPIPPGIVFGLTFGLIGGLVSNSIELIITRIPLRFSLLLSKDVPLNYRAFLDHCAAIGLLRKLGTGYIFIHRYLLEYFAESPFGDT